MSTYSDWYESECYKYQCRKLEEFSKLMIDYEKKHPTKKYLTNIDVLVYLNSNPFLDKKLP